MKSLKLFLDNDGSAKRGVIRIPDSSHTIQVVIKVGTKFHSHNTVISTNSPDSKGNSPQVITPSRPFSMLEDLTFDIILTTPGVFNLQAVNGEERAQPVPFIIDPVLNVNGREVRCSSLSIQTNYARCIGHVSDWVKNLKPVADLGYNMIHIPPFQELGGKSQYSIKDQLAVSHELFPEGFPAEKRWPALKEAIQNVEKQLNVSFMSDIVLNHTSPNSEWIKEKPECGYNVENTPHFAAALFVDQLLQKISLEIAQGKNPQFPPNFPEDKLPLLEQFLETQLKKSDLWKYFLIDVDEAIDQLKEAGTKELDSKFFKMLRVRSVNFPPTQRLNLLRSHGVHGNKIDINYAVALYSSPDMNNRKKIEEYRAALMAINGPGLSHLSDVIREITTNVINHIRYNRFEANGPRLGPITEQEPLVPPYFARIETKKGPQYLVCNGWIFGANPTTDFTHPDNEAYLRRQVVIWTDSIKLRYGKSPEDNPFLWDHMTKYIQSVASVVKGLRIDNAHSTPIHVAEYFIRKAREINPQLYIMAELFTGNEDDDINYINRLGINSIMRNAYHKTSPSDITRLLWSSGGRAVAAVDSLDERQILHPQNQIPSVIFDLTHDDGKVSYDRLLISSVVSMSCSPIASTRGYDDFLDFNPHVVFEYRKYPLNLEEEALQPVRRIINQIHTYMADDGMEELMSNYYGNIVSIFRFNSQSGNGVWLVARFDGETTLNSIGCPCPIDSLVLESRILQTTNDKSTDKEIIPGQCKLLLNTDISKLTSCYIRDGNVLELSNFPTGSVVIFKTKINADLAPLDLLKLTDDFETRMKMITLGDISTLLFRCEDEEQFAQKHGCYGFPEFGNCFYAGIAGPLLAFNSATDMGSPIFENIRNGDWLLDFMMNRMFSYSNLLSVEGGLRANIRALRSLPRFMMPKYIYRMFTAIFEASKRKCISLMSDFVKNGDDFVQQLALSSLEFYGPPPLINEQLRPSFGRTLSFPQYSLAAGLPHFSSGYMRCWGRDTFIALRGIFLVTGRYEEARDHLLSFAACVRHGLVPNLLDGGGNCRYNSRDATWWFLQSLQDYVLLSGDNIFTYHVPQIFPTDSEDIYNSQYKNRPNRPMRLVSDIVQEIMDRHAKGIHFREWGAGKRIDAVMKDNGFNVDIFTDWNNGFILGGNPDNCGTWMDKMGTSQKAKNIGVPASPRDGAPIEIVGLLQSTLRFLQMAVDDNLYPHKGVNRDGKLFTWAEWSNLLVSNFEGWFYIPTKPEHDDRYFIEQSRVSVRGIYKDTVGASNEFGDYQFRPNLLVAMTVAPELFDPYHAVRCLDIVETNLLGELGMKTLDPSDWNYHPYYDHDSDSDDKFTAQGFNYHNGPEWLWLTGFFFRASMRFRRPFTPKMKKVISNLKRAFKESPAFGLPELTNKDGEFCSGSCLTQAWSTSSVLDLLFDYSVYTEDDAVDWSNVDLPDD